MGQRLDSLAALAKAARIRPDERLRDEAIAAMALPDVRRVPGWHASPPGTTAVAYDGQYRLYARADDRGSHQHPQHPRRPGDPAHRLGPHPGELPVLQPRRAVPARPRTKGTRCSVWRVADGQPALRDELRGVPVACFQPGRPAAWRSASKTGSSASTWRPVRK